MREYVGDQFGVFGRQGCRFGGGKQMLYLLAFPLHKSFPGFGLLSRSLSEQVFAMVGSDAVNPGGKRGVSAKSREGLISFYENILGRVLGLGRTGEKRQAEPDHQTLISADKRGVSLSVACDNCLDNFEIFPRQRISAAKPKCSQCDFTKNHKVTTSPGCSRDKNNNM